MLVLARHYDAGIPASGASVHPSFEQSLGMALRDRLSFGSRILFTYGPLGWFNSSPYIPELYWAKYAWELVVRGFASALWIALAARLARPWERVVFVACLFLPGMSSDSWWFLAALALFAWVSAERRASLAWFAVAVLGWTLIALVKFTFLVFAALCALAALASAWSRVSKSAWLARALLALLLPVCVWCALGQELASLPVYLGWSLELSSGYSAAMSQPAPPLALTLAAATALLALAAMSMQLGSHARAPHAWSAALLFVAGLFVAFKGGFVRYDGAVMFFGFAAGAPFVLATAGDASAGLRPRLERASRAARLATVALSIAGTLVVAPGIDSLRHVWWHATNSVGANLPRLFAPRAERDHLDQLSRARENAFALPRVRAAVGDEGVEVFGWEHAVLALNHLRWNPRFVPQAYSVLTERLAERNARDLEAPGAPRFVLLRGGPLDLRLPTLEDGLALRVLLRDYRPRLAEGGFVLFERASTAPQREALREEPLVERELAFGEVLALDAELSTIDPGASCLMLRMGLRATAAGRARAFLYNAPPVWLEVELEDGARTRWRLLPELASSGALIAPFLADHDALVRWVRGAPVARVRRLSVVEPESGWGGACWLSPVHVSVSRVEGLVPRVSADRARALEFSMFATPPTRTLAAQPPRRAMFRERLEVLVVRPPASLVYELPAGRHRVRATLGLQREPVGGALSGARFLVRVRSAGEPPRVAWERELDPLARPDDRFLSQLDLELDFESPATVELVTEALVDGPTALAPFWSGISVE